MLVFHCSRVIECVAQICTLWQEEVVKSIISKQLNTWYLSLKNEIYIILTQNVVEIEIDVRQDDLTLKLCFRVNVSTAILGLKFSRNLSIY